MSDRTLGVLADDYTGGSDVAAALRRQGVPTSLVFGDPTGLQPPTTPAVVVGLKTRTAPVAEAVGMSVATARWLLRAGAERLYVKYCSTFDSTAQGNIGPVVDAVLDLVGAAQTVICPASPEHGRTTYQGHLFVHDTLLSDSSMAHHPLTPMSHADLRRLLHPQTPHQVGLIPQPTVAAGPQAIGDELSALLGDGVRHVVTDALNDDDLDSVARASEHLAVVTGGAGLAGALGRVSAPTSKSRPGVARPPQVPAIVVAGSCSLATLGQVAAAESAMPAHRIDPLDGNPDALMARVLAFLDQNRSAPRLLVYSSAGAEERRWAAEAGVDIDGATLETLLAQTAAEAVRRGVRRVVVAGGETSGAVVNELGVRIVEVGDEEVTGVPWCHTPGPDPLWLLLKSGNFGDEQFLERASR